MRSWLKAVSLPALLAVVPPNAFMIAYAGPRPQVAMVTAFAMPVWFAACAAYAGWRVMQRDAGGDRAAALAGVATFAINYVLLLLLVGLWVATPWGSLNNVGVIKLFEILPWVGLGVVVLGVSAGWVGGRAALRQARRSAA